MKNDSSQSWVIILAVIAISLSIVLLLSNKYQKHSGSDHKLELEYEYAEKTATYPEPAPEALTPAATAQYAIQIMSLSYKEKATGVVTKITESGLTGFTVPADLGEKGMAYRVYLGPYPSKDEAARALQSAQEMYPGAFLTQVKGF